MLCITTFALAQTITRTDETMLVPSKNYKFQNSPVVSPAYLTMVSFNNSDCITKEDAQLMQKQIDDNITMLRKKNPGACKVTTSVHPLFIWPTQAKAGFTDYGYYTVQFLVDHDQNVNNNLLDYNCGTRTYDWATGNHAGTDIILWPYAWRRMDEQVEEIIAAAPGVIVNKVDGNFDRNCVNNGSGTWNAIHVLHSDGSIAWYLHFKTGSLTNKVIGDSVAVGEYLGTAGSSGSSSWPHVHFQVQTSIGSLIDPWDGSCNSTTTAGDTWWQNQQPYNVPSINRICTKNSQVDYYNCPNPEITYERDTFNIGDSLWLWIYTRDLELNSTMQINIYNPSGINVINFPFTVPWATSPTSYVRWTYNVVDAWWTQGWWKFEVVYNGETYYHMFYMTHSAVGLEEDNRSNIISIYPNPSNNEIEITGITFESGDEITITDAVGNNIYQNKLAIPSQSIKLSTLNFTNGIYFVKLKTKEGLKSKKLLIQH